MTNDMNFVGLTAAEHIDEGQRTLSGLFDSENSDVDRDLIIKQAHAHFAAAQAINGLSAEETSGLPHGVADVEYATMTDEELWNSPVGERLRHYGDKLLAAEVMRIMMKSRRRTEAVVAEGVEYGRAVLSPLGDPNSLITNKDGAPTRADTDPWASWQSTELTGLRGAVAATDGTREAVQKAAKRYLADLALAQKR
ncbi:hypothetical protein ABZS76_32960 [Streptomyces sp. NPDC005562]|uniref:hypothetical protein n=1 Tax=Streptomyces sp. NPDC005562 TaxID=3154890 RepID=UPI0033B86D33